MRLRPLLRSRLCVLFLFAFVFLLNRDSPVIGLCFFWVYVSDEANGFYTPAQF